MALVFRNLLSHEECQEIISFVHTPTAKIITMPSMSFVDDPLTVNPIEHDFKSQEYRSKLLALFPNHDVSLNFKVLEYVPGCKLELHTDTDYLEWPLSVLIYLNTVHPDNGGALFFEDGSYINPVEGTAVLFLGSKTKHGVKELLRGERYVLTGWLKKNPRSNARVERVIASE